MFTVHSVYYSFRFSCFRPNQRSRKILKVYVLVRNEDRLAQILGYLFVSWT